jgi:hypothetical protein
MSRGQYSLIARSIIRSLAGCLFILLFIPFAHCQQRTVLFHEDFASLADWKPLYFPKIKEHTQYTIESSGGERFLRAESNNSASALVHRREFNVSGYPKVRWRWKTSNVYARGDSGDKSGDDYPIRVYILFKYDPEKASLMEKARYGLAKQMYGEYPPHSTLSYVWASKEGVDRIFTSPYTGQAKLIALQKGNRNVGPWQDEEVDILKDYREAFGTAPPAIASIAVMNDSDNTHEKSVSCIAYVEVFRNGR